MTPALAPGFLATHLFVALNLNRTRSAALMTIRWPVALQLVTLFLVLHATLWFWSIDPTEPVPLRETDAALAFFSLGLATGYTLVAHVMIVYATWYGIKGWHGLLALLVILFGFLGPHAAGAHNVFDSLMQHGTKRLYWFDELLFQWTLTFAIAISLRPLVNGFLVQSKHRRQIELVDLFWVTLGIAMACFGWQRLSLQPPSHWGVIVAFSQSLTAASMVLVFTWQRKRLAIILLAITLGVWMFAASTVAPANVFPDPFSPSPGGQMGGGGMM
ncbi:hypothetical protein CA13_33430 [Planctomycetes bacterium CA13]|uniref:Uncharacterized protein n=1 Tax=Novipirellula herctigrandis TaxID=2527986 RepID=A0A5C5Z3H2_9BACT|nr:hypothetical protein CA13_33430 [Planctomycetes bacterium CA13]